jgi:hypothetical protein
MIQNSTKLLFVQFISTKNYQLQQFSRKEKKKDLINLLMQKILKLKKEKQCRN